MRKRLGTKGFTLAELLVATFIITLTAAGTFLLLGSGAQFGARRSHRYEAFEYASQTFDTLKDYITPNTGGNPIYHLQGDDPGPGCGGPAGANRYALSPLSGAQNHCHPLPSGALKDQLGGKRSYQVEDVDINGDTKPDYKRVVITLDWTEKQ